jgi:hypothetical protein
MGYALRIAAAALALIVGAASAEARNSSSPAVNGLVDTFDSCELTTASEGFRFDDFSGGIAQETNSDAQKICDTAGTNKLITCEVDADCGSGGTCSLFDNKCSLYFAEGNPTLDARASYKLTQLPKRLAHVAINVTDSHAYPEKPIAGFQVNGGATKGCYLALTEQSRKMQSGNVVPIAYRLDVFAKDNGYYCDSGSRNPWTPCVPDANYHDTDTCAETAIGEGRCQKLPLAAISGVHGAYTEVALIQEASAGETRCRLFQDGNPAGAGTRKTGLCSVDGWGCASNAECYYNDGTEDWTGRCADWVLEQPYPLDETSVMTSSASRHRCRANTDCRTCGSDADCGGDPGSCSGGRCVCTAQTCTATTTQEPSKFFVGPADDVGGKACALGDDLGRLCSVDGDCPGGGAGSCITAKYCGGGFFVGNFCTTATQLADCGSGVICGADNRSYDIHFDTVAIPAYDATAFTDAEGQRWSYLRGVRIDPVSDGATVQWASTGCAGNRFECVDDESEIGSPPFNDGGTTNIAEGATGEKQSLNLENAAVALTDWGACSGATAEVPGTCASNSGKTCFEDADCEEALPDSVVVTAWAVARDDGEGALDGDDDNAQNKQAQWRFYDNGNEANISSGLGYATIGANHGNDFEKSIPGSLSGPTWVSAGTPWSVAYLNDLGFQLDYFESGTAGDVTVTAASAWTVVARPTPVLPRTITDQNDDGRISVGFGGDSTWSPASFHVLVMGKITQPDDVIFYTLGSMTSADATKDIDNILSGYGADSTGVTWNGPYRTSYAQRGNFCDPTIEGRCRSLDLFIPGGYGFNDLHPGSPGITAPRATGLCWDPNDPSEHGDPCECHEATGAAVSDNLGYCLANTPSFVGGESAGSTCAYSAGSAACSTYSTNPNLCGDGYSLGRCNTGTSLCTAPAYWSGKTHSCDHNADCDTPSSWCAMGCGPVPGCSGTGAVCIGPKQTSTGFALELQQFADAAAARNADADPSNNVLVVAMTQAAGSRPNTGEPDAGCWAIWGHLRDRGQSRLLQWARQRGLFWIDDNGYARANCEDGLQGNCTTDGAHKNDDGFEYTSEIIERCVENTDGPSSTYYSCGF